ncbi:MAG TPA: acyl-CoA dehydratase activase [Intrasporangium sp.]|uniref:acyl-CoA dehydratase activase n=1 Tax=Intrasporangium sp. TaxID=1925024 RepID=UPI002D79CCF9|nr:acyl-CoA dehydratase activase [Intrasporangium sp.]HET7399873.1 acyl-CoA dehydratase activase [Intrasporangium sp.]
MSLHTMGVDLGSTTAKAVVVDEGGEIVAHRVVQMGAVSRRGVTAAIEAVLDAARLERRDLDHVVATGYGRRLVPDVDRTFTEITCHARGVAAMCPGAALVIDIGGQDSKAIRVDSAGLVDTFAMNDRCASGTGRFFDVLARALECELTDLDDLALTGTHDLEVSSMCATFAETEIISLLAEGAPPTDIAASVHRAVCSRTIGLVSQVGRATPVIMTGGVARSRAAVRFLSEALRAPVQVPSEPQISGAYGAALLGLEALRGQATVVGQAVDREHVHTGSRATGHDCTRCSVGGGTYRPVDVELWTSSIAADRRP